MLSSAQNQSKHTIPRYASFDDFFQRSPLWFRLKEFDDPDVNALRTTIQKVAIECAGISKKIIATMPFYTLHDERHILNLLSWSELLTPVTTLDRMPPLEIGLCILAVMIHDLGMAQPLDEQRAIRSSDADSPERQAYERFVEGRFDEELQMADRLATSKMEDDKSRAHLIHQHVLSEYLRSTHASPTGDRIQKWLQEIKAIHGDRIFQFAQSDFETELTWIAASHNLPVDWLREKLKRTSGGSYHRIVRDGDRVNFAFPGLLLRLADIMDFDSSRTPSILFRHLGLDEDLGIDLSVSHNEWSKHLAVTGIERRQNNGQQQIVYAAACCPHPVVEKAIRTFSNSIAEELRGVREELARQQLDPTAEGNRFQIDLPEVKVEIEARRIDGQPIYRYEDVNFHLDHDEILHLLMGEKLYGDPSLCVRELLQNALDACELRDLRLQLQSQGVQPSEPVDGTPISNRRGFFLDTATGREQRLEVRLSWGIEETTERYWLEVEDNGVGMSEDHVRRYFTQIGKSYYRSPDFRQEQLLLRSTGMFATPISQFGIGILSCFMLADQIEVRTCPGNHGPDRPPRDITISGPGSLFWIREGTRSTEGTVVRLWLKRAIGSKPVSLRHNKDQWLDRLRGHFGWDSWRKFTRDPYSSGDVKITFPDYETLANAQISSDLLSAGEDEVSVDPAEAAAQWIVWPRYPILVEGHDKAESEINHRFHLDILSPINDDKVGQKAKEWRIAGESVQPLKWAAWDWEDRIGSDATGSRIRIWYPCLAESSDTKCKASPPDPHILHCALTALVEPQLESIDARKNGRQRLLMNGIAVPDIGMLQPTVLVKSPGMRVWLDLRGAALLPLTSDRKTALPPENPREWVNCLKGVLQRFRSAIVDHCSDLSHVSARPLAHWTRYRKATGEIEPSQNSPLLIRRTNWLKDILGLCTDASGVHLALLAFLQSNMHWRVAPQILSYYLKEDALRNLERRAGLDPGKTMWFSIDAEHDDPAFKLALSQMNTELDFHRFLLLHVADKGRVVTMRDPLNDNGAYRQFPAIADVLAPTILQEAFFPSLEGSWPWFGLYTLHGSPTDAHLVGPSVLEFFGADSCVHAAKSDEEHAMDVVKRGYHLVFPTTMVALGKLRRNCDDWQSNQQLRRNVVLPFLMPTNSEFGPQLVGEMRQKLGCDEVYVLFSSRHLWEVPFTDWGHADWADDKNISALWDLKTGHVLWAKGTGNIEWVRRVGVRASQFFDFVNWVPRRGSQRNKGAKRDQPSTSTGAIRAKQRSFISVWLDRLLGR